MGLWLIDVAFKESEDSSSFIIHRDDELLHGQLG
jgi:hypothetical protein